MKPQTFFGRAIPALLGAILFPAAAFAAARVMLLEGAFRMKTRYSWLPGATYIAFGAVVASLSTTGTAVAGSIVVDTTIGTGSSLNGQNITIADGVDGPTTVELIDGGSVEGFAVTGNSTLIIDGGTSTFLSSVSDNARLIIRNGTCGCSEPVCLVIDYDSLLTASGTSQLHFFGGTFGGPLRLEEASTAHFYGRNLEVNEFGGFLLVTGEYPGGDEVNVFLHPFTEVGPAIQLHEIPEPASLAISVLGMLTVVLYCRR